MGKEHENQKRKVEVGGKVVAAVDLCAGDVDCEKDNDQKETGRGCGIRCFQDQRVFFRRRCCSCKYLVRFLRVCYRCFEGIIAPEKEAEEARGFFRLEEEEKGRKSC